jgi:hypothetical protein
MIFEELKWSASRRSFLLKGPIEQKPNGFLLWVIN